MILWTRILNMVTDNMKWLQNMGQQERTTVFSLWSFCRENIFFLLWFLCKFASELLLIGSWNITGCFSQGQQWATDHSVCDIQPGATLIIQEMHTRSSQVPHPCWISYCVKMAMGWLQKDWAFLASWMPSSQYWKLNVLRESSCIVSVNHLQGTAALGQESRIHCSIWYRTAQIICGKTLNYQDYSILQCYSIVLYSILPINIFSTAGHYLLTCKDFKY